MPSRLLPDVIDIYESTSAITRALSLPQSSPRIAENGAPGLSMLLLSSEGTERMIPFTDLMTRAASLFASAGIGMELLIAATGSPDRAVLDYVEGAPDHVRLLISSDDRISGLQNELAGLARYDRLLFCRAGVSFASPEQVLRLWRISQDRGPDPLGVLLRLPGGGVHDAGVKYGGERQHPQSVASPDPGESVDSHPGPVREALAVTSDCLIVGRSWFGSAGGFDESYRVECHDTDFCLSAGRLGARVGIVDVGRVIRSENGDTPAATDRSDRTLFARRWQSYLQARSYLQGRLP